ncbi:MAG: 2Fe-2S iron-sulfur cluster binding domain-containing protein [Phycisphaerales bacterium]|nr:2Fe-2S iron-sulfur cluster binding domain-containing protein [Phycisphaerae bacterium]NNF45070.1 2Fe-2S iron-sulfur cluster binding domain-containing protein [Phycisphaerales bacterium]NNM25899.1 2Fe-2S iron-sulfur cluster binding domain-containing protein [Phycisphaerales bacterium]
MTPWLEYLWIPGAVAVGAVAVQALVMTFNFVMRHTHEVSRRQGERELLHERVMAARRESAAREEKSLSWSGFRKFEIVKKCVEDAKGEICSFYLAPHDRKPIPGFAPGQYLTFSVAVPDEPKPIVRCYSLSDAPRPDHYRVTIKRAPAPALASSFFLDQLEEGSICDVRAPTGHFFLDLSRPTPVVLIGGGIGVTPVLSMLNAICETPGMRETWFFYGVRDAAELTMREHLETIEREHPNINVRICYSRVPPEEIPDGVCHIPGRVTAELLKTHLPSNNYDFLFCGPKPMMDGLCADLAEWGVPTDRLHFEDFGPAAGTPTIDPNASTGPLITFKKSNKTINWNESAESLWHLAAANGIDIEAGCRCGACGTCERAIIDGAVEYTKPTTWEYEDGACLTCCCVPKGPVELDA